MDNVRDVARRWGGDFKVDYRKNSENIIDVLKRDIGGIEFVAEIKSLAHQCVHVIDPIVSQIMI